MTAAHQPATMRALVCQRFGPPAEVIALATVPQPPAPGPHEVRVAIAYASVSHATGLLIEGRYQRRPPLPFIPGTEAVGRVEACGHDVDHVRPGDRVAFIADWGSYADAVVIDASTVYPIPERVGWLQALPLPLSYGTAFTALHWRVPLAAGDSLLVLGAGSGVGAAAVEVAHQAPGVTVIACASTAAKRETARRLGADVVVEPEHLVDQVRAATEGRGAQHVFDPVGGELLLQALSAVAPHGQLISIGFASGTVPQVPLNRVLVKNLTLHGFFYGRYIGWTPDDERRQFAPQLRRAIATLMTWTAEGRIHPEVSRLFEPAELVDALEALHGRQVTGKVAIRLGGDDT